MVAQRRRRALRPYAVRAGHRDGASRPACLLRTQGCAPTPSRPDASWRSWRRRMTGQRVTARRGCSRHRGR